VYERDRGGREPTYTQLDAELWRTLLYVGWYSIASAEAVRAIYPAPARVDPARLPVLPTGIERRGFRGDAGRAKAAAFLNAVVDWAQPLGGLTAWVSHYAMDGFTPARGATLAEGRERGWERVRAGLAAAPGAGPWATYKWADLVKNVHGYPIDAPNIGDKLGETAGPIPGMVRLTGLPWQECAGTPRLQRDLLSAANDAGAGLGGLDQLETALCDFNSLCRGNYYLGLDLDAQMTSLPESMLHARDVFPARYRGELMGWTGVRSGLKTVYRDTGRIVNF
jgi:hypothetical protein